MPISWSLSTRSLEKVGEHRGAAFLQVLVPLRLQHGVKGPSDELHAPRLEPPAAVLLRQHQRGRRRVDGDAVGELPLAGQLQPLEPVPVRAGEQVRRHRRRLLLP